MIFRDPVRHLLLNYEVPAIYLSSAYILFQVSSNMASLSSSEYRSAAAFVTQPPESIRILWKAQHFHSTTQFPKNGWFSFSRQEPVLVSTCIHYQANKWDFLIFSSKFVLDLCFYLHEDGKNRPGNKKQTVPRHSFSYFSFADSTPFLVRGQFCYPVQGGQPSEAYREVAPKFDVILKAQKFFKDFSGRASHVEGTQ